MTSRPLLCSCLGFLQVGLGASNLALCIPDLYTTVSVQRSYNKLGYCGALITLCERI
jgi:hypothetical protein